MSLALLITLLHVTSSAFKENIPDSVTFQCNRKPA